MFIPGCFKNCSPLRMLYPGVKVSRQLHYGTCLVGMSYQTCTFNYLAICFFFFFFHTLSGDSTPQRFKLLQEKGRRIVRTMSTPQTAQKSSCIWTINLIKLQQRLKVNCVPPATTDQFHPMTPFPRILVSLTSRLDKSRVACLPTIPDSETPKSSLYGRWNSILPVPCCGLSSKEYSG